jgi:nicotinamide-nucleotide amidase
MYSDDILHLAQSVLAEARGKGLQIATAESCTGGLIAGALTAIPGSSDVLDRGFVTYTNAAKTQMLGVAETLIARHGAVSEEVACAMAEGALLHSHADLAVACTGIAGPDGATRGKPAGLVHLAAARKGQSTLHEECRFGDIGRDAVRMKSVENALKLLFQAM